MKLQKRNGFYFFLLIAVLGGCSSVSKHPAETIVALVDEKTAAPVFSENQTASFVSELPEEFRSLISDGLTLEEAIQISLANSPEFLSKMEAFSLAQADRNEAMLLKNPKFSGFVRSSDDAENNNTEFEVTVDVVNWFLLPLRHQISKAALEKVRFQMIDAAIAFRAKVKKAFYTAQAAEQKLKSQREVLEAAEAAAEISERQFKAGNIKEIDWAEEKTGALQAAGDYDAVLMENIAAREKLNRLLGLSGAEAQHWKIQNELKSPDDSDVSFENLEEIAVANRFDLLALKKQWEENGRRRTAERLGFLKEAALGMNTEKETDGERISGMVWETDVPLMDWNQASLQRVNAATRQTYYELQNLELTIRSEVRFAAARLEKKEVQVRRYEQEILPLHTKIVSLTQGYYNYMLQGVHQLLQSKKEEIEMRREWIQALQDYWTAYADLERIVGGRLPDRPQAVSKKAASSPVLEKTSHAAHADGGHS